MREKNTGKLAVLALFITIIILAPTQGAQSINKVLITDTLSTGGKLTETLIISITDNNRTEFIFSLPDNSDNITVNNVYIGNNNSLNIPLACKTCEIDISYSLNNVIKLSGSDLVFSRTLNFPDSPLNMNYSMILPQGYLVDQSGNNSIDPSIVPSPSSIVTNGKNIQINWNQKNPVLPQIFLVRYKMAPIESKPNYTFLIWFALIFIAGGVAGYFASRHIHLKMPKKLSLNPKAYIIPSTLLSPDEKAIIELLKKNKNVMNQKDVVKSLEWSKSKVSAIMTNLDYKKIIEREKHGRNYKVKLIKEISES